MAAFRFRRHIQGRIRRRDEARSRSSQASSLQPSASSARSFSNQGLGCTSGSCELSRGFRFQGHTSWQMSHPATQPCRAAAMAPGSSGSRFSIV